MVEETPEIPKDKLKKIVSESHLDFLYDLYRKEIYIGNDNIELLKKHGRIQKNKPVDITDDIFDNVNHTLLNMQTEGSRLADSRIDIIEVDKVIKESNIEIITSEELEERRSTYGHLFEGRDQEITRDEWAPKSTTEHEDDFIAWIDSINQNGFTNKIKYRKFTLYCQQAYQWLSENKSFTQFEDEDEQYDFFMEELRRCDENALYFLNKYGYYKEGDAEDKSGTAKYVARPVHELFAYLDDCGYSVGIAKGRQIAATTTLMMLDVRDVVFKSNHFMKFITEDVDKAEEIFEDKLKFAFSELPSWMRPNVLNERDNLFKIGYKTEKGKKEGVGSKILVVAPKRTAIAGGAPQKVKIDEAGNIGILGIMIGNARPTMMWTNPKTKKMEIKRRLWFWGTGGEMEKGGKAFETEFMAIMKQWQERDFSSAIVPIFLDWTCRFGATEADYEREKAVAYAKGNNEQDPDAKKHITEFHQSWPRSLSDVFRTSAKTLVDDEYIERELKRIREARNFKKGQALYERGYFEPVYDTAQPMPEGSDVPYKIIGVNFIPTDDFDRRASVTIFMHPSKEWVNRYFQGTDPIATYTGSSNFSSSIWDKEFKTLSAVLDWRVPDYPQVFLQATLLGMYYNTSQTKKRVHELLESNIGSSYTDYLKNKNFDRELVLNYQLPDILQNNTTINEGVGIDNKGQRNQAIIHRMFEMINFYGGNIYIPVIFEQLKTFTCKVSENGKQMWGPVNRKHFMDDTLFSATYAYICAELCFPELVPKNLSSSKSKYVYEYKMVRGADNKLSRIQVKKRIE